jgi:hypothetical protein
MVCSGRARLLGALFVLVAGLATEAASKDKSRPCVYSEHSPGSAEEPAKRSRLVLSATTPAEGEAVHPGTVIGIDVEYHVANFAPGRYRLVITFPISFQDRPPRWMTPTVRALSRRRKARRTCARRSADCSPRKTFAGNCRCTSRSRRAPAGAQVRCKPRLVESPFHRPTSAPGRWNGRSWRRRKTTFTRSTPSSCIGKSIQPSFGPVWPGCRTPPPRSMSHIELHLVFSGEPGEFIGRYLRIVNEHVASRSAVAGH